MKINKMIGTDGTELEVHGKVSKRGFAKVKITKVGSHLLAREGQTIEGFNVVYGVIKFEEA